MTDLDPATAPAASRGPVDRFARWTGLAAGALAAALLAPLDHGAGVLYAIPAAGLCAVGGVLVADLLTAPSRGAVRTAGLAPRRIRAYVPPRMTALLLVLALALVLLLVLAGALATPDDLGRAGRALTLTCHGTTERHSPWPGFFYGLPVLGSLTAATAVCGWSLRRIATRPGDDRSRRDRSLAVVAAWGFVVSGSLVGVTVTACGTLAAMTCDGTPGTAATAVLLPLALVSLVTAGGTLLTVCSPRATGRSRAEGGESR
ncbi:hypothetical protein [Streptomyces sp. NRRL S-1022]|uniref:hypothetical protein n=1 Tax=Streptomyces sp. NRRL S-1022 TaxID=1463880 RepID=UPI00068CA5BA|nr:hypothetical protein [Streptomyces sp. NRRL S-1022]